VLEEFRDTDIHTAKLLQRLEKLEIILANKKSRSAATLDGVSEVIYKNDGVCFLIRMLGIFVNDWYICYSL
jgi:hypothetical protein